MSFRPNFAKKPVQDMPPPGGFPEINFNLKSPRRGPSGMQLWGISSVLIMWGFYRIGKGNRERSAEQAADRELRYAMAPVLQAESDRWYVAREMEIKQKEAEIMKDVPGFRPGESVYLTKRWVPRQFTEMDTNYKK